MTASGSSREKTRKNLEKTLVKENGSGDKRRIPRGREKNVRVAERERER